MKRLLEVPEGTPWWRDPEVMDALLTGVKVAAVDLIVLAATLVPIWP